MINSLLNWIKFCIESSDAYARRKSVRVCVFMNWSEPPVDSIKMTHSVFLTALSVSQSPTLILGRELAPAALQQWWTNWTETWNNSFVINLLSLIWLLTFFSNPKPEFGLLHTHTKILLFHQGGLWSEKLKELLTYQRGYLNRIIQLARYLWRRINQHITRLPNYSQIKPRSSSLHSVWQLNLSYYEPFGWVSYPSSSNGPQGEADS